MSKISLKHSGGKVVSLNSPTTEPNANDVAFKLPNADGSDGQALVTDGAGNLSFANAGSGTARNLIINGGMTISQRYGTTVQTGKTSGGYFIDRFIVVTSGSIGTWSFSQSTDAPDGFANSFKIDCTTQNSSLDSGDVIQLRQAIEGFNVQDFAKGTSSAKKFALSFYVKTTKLGTYIVELQDVDNDRTVSATYTVSNTNWNKYTVIFPADTTGAFDNNNEASLRVHHWLTAGSDYSTGTLSTTWAAKTNANRVVGGVNLGDDTANEWLITGVQLEVGSVATDFEHRSFGQELALCHRYCNALMSYGSGDINGNTLYNADYAGGNGMVRMSIPRMRLIPTLTYSIYGGSITYNFSSFDLLQLFDSGDSNFYIYDVLCEAEL